jgi:hypothetical protein
MRIRCFHCGKSVSTEVPDETLLRAIAICPECCDPDVRAAQEKAAKEKSDDDHD